MPSRPPGAFAPHLRQMTRFATVGAMNTAVDFVVFGLLFYGAGLPVLLANTLSYGAGLANSFVMNKRWTFAESRGHGRPLAQFALFALLNLGGLGLSNLTVWLLAPALGPLPAKLCATGATFLWNFWSSRRFVYRPPAPR